MPFLQPPQSRTKGSPSFLLLAHLMKGVEEPGAGKDDRARIPKWNRKKMKLRPRMTFPHASEPPPGERRPHSFPPGQQHQSVGGSRYRGPCFLLTESVFQPLFSKGKERKKKRERKREKEIECPGNTVKDSERWDYSHVTGRTTPW